MRDEVMHIAYNYHLYERPTLREEIAKIAEEAFDLGYRVLPFREHKRVECLPVLQWWDISQSRDGSQRLYLYKGRKHYYIHYWVRALFEGEPLDWCLVIPKDSALGKRITKLISRFQLESEQENGS
jgi:hypothetical protein